MGLGQVGGLLRKKKTPPDAKTSLRPAPRVQQRARATRRVETKDHKGDPSKMGKGPKRDSRSGCQTKKVGTTLGSMS